MSARRSAISTGCAAIVLVLAAMLPVSARAQDYERIAPHEPSASPAPALAPPAAARPAPASRAAVIPRLNGLVFVSGMEEVRTGGLPAKGAGPVGIVTADVPALADPGFVAQMRRYIGRPLSLADLQDITAATTDWLRAHSRPFVSVTVPPQNVTSGVVQIVVSEYRVGTVQVAGNRWFSSDLLTAESGIRPGQTLNLDDLEADLAWLNGNPFRTVNTIFKPGQQPGTTDVLLQTQDRPPFRVYGTYDNQGAPTLGRDEWGAGAIWGNVAGLDQTLAYQLTRSFSGRYTAHALSWTAPLPWRDKLLVFGSYATESPDAGPFFDETGHSGQASLRYVHNLPSVDLGGGLTLRQDFQLGYDFKSTNNDLEFGGIKVFSSDVEISQFPIIYDATLADPYGQTTFQNQLVVSPGGMTGANSDSAFSAVVPGATASYVYDKAGVTRTTFLPDGFSWTVRALAQLANRNLMYSEQLGLGGMDSVRGYDTDAAIGSRGVILSQEVRAPAFSLGDMLGLKMPVKDREQLGLFWDYGHVSQVEDIPGEVNSADLSSVGLDLHTSIGDNLDLSFDTGYKLNEVPGVDGRGGFADVALTVGF